MPLLNGSRRWGFQAWWLRPVHGSSIIDTEHPECLQSQTDTLAKA
jgi:hypothetical protein